jgi:hypothetical protein
LQAGSWLISIFAALGAAPSNFTAPLTEATVLGSIGVAAAAGAAVVAGAEGCASVGSSFLLQPTSIHRLRRQSKPNIATDVFLFMMSPFREVLKAFLKV